jgi:hypothetical protein
VNTQACGAFLAIDERAVFHCLHPCSKTLQKHKPAP